MFRINNKIQLQSLSPNTNHVFRNEETNPFVSSSFKCCKCNHENKFKIIPYETGFGFLEIYQDNNVLSKEEILEKKIATETSSWASYLGDLTVNDLATLYFGMACEKCHSNHLIVFCYGEKQPGLVVLEISGVWNFTTNPEPSSQLL
jgi:hypothetical protein